MSKLNSEAANQPSSSAFYRAVWRWHFYAGLYVIPFLMMLAVTGLFMLWFTAIAPEFGERLTLSPGSASLRISEQADAASNAYPAGKITQYIAPLGNHNPALFRMVLENGDRMLAVDPYTGIILRDVPQENTWNDFFTRVHGSLFLGAKTGGLGDLLIEIAAGLGIVLLITGIYLWWPRNGRTLGDVLVPNLALRGRLFWKELHTSIGFYGSVIILFFLISGLAWAGVWGGKFVQAWSTFPAEKWDNVPLSDQTHATMNHGALKEVPWALEQTLMPVSGSKEGIAGLPQNVPVVLESVVALGRAIGFEGRFQVTFPSDEKGVWTLSQDSMSYDSPNPTSDRTVHVDQYTGKILASVGYADYSLPGKAMAIGIALHEGQMGLWNVVLNFAFCIMILTICISGIAMWWIRRPSKVFRLGPPPMPENFPLWKNAAIIAVLLSIAFPLVGATLIAAILLDVILLSRVPVLKRIFK